MNYADRLQQEWQSRQENKEARQAEIERRTREHQLKVARLKKHRKIRKFAGPDALNIHAIGDLWFEYPLDGNVPIPFFNSAIVAETCKLGAKGTPNPNILNEDPERRKAFDQPAQELHAVKARQLRIKDH